MVITFSEIVYLLSKTHSIRQVKDAYFDASLTSVKKYRGQVDKGQLYTIPIGRIPELIRHPLEKLRECAFIAWGRGTDEEMLCWQKLVQGKMIQGKRGSLDIAYVQDIEFLEDLQEELVDLFFSLHIWENRMKELIEQESSNLNAMLAVGRSILGRPLAIFDRNFIVVGCTEDYFQYFPDMKDRLINHQMSHSDIKSLLQDEDYLNADKQNGVFIYPSEPSENNLYCYNIRISGEFAARALMVLPSFTVVPGLSQLYQCFVRYVEQLYCMQIRKNPTGNQDDVLHHLFKKYLFHPRRKDYEVDFHALNMYNWFRYDEYQILVLQMFGVREFEKGASYLCQQLERLFEYSCTFRTDREIIWIINYTRERSIKGKEDFYANFPYLIRDFGCKAGISDSFYDFTLLSNYRRQADIALEIGNQKDSYRWYYMFKDYTLDYMVSQITTVFDAKQLSHKGLQTLNEYDKEHDTEFVKTLYYYITNGFNASEAAQKLYIHRTTFIRRMERIESLISLNMSDSDELLHLLLTFKMFGGKDGKINE